MMFKLFSPVRCIHSGIKQLYPSINAAKFEDEFDKNHIKINPFQKVLLSAGCAAISLFDPTRADTIACLGETGGDAALHYMYEKLQTSNEGLQILNDKPRINSKTVDLEKLKNYPSGTLGKIYSNFLVKNNVTPDSRQPVQFVDDINLAYTIQRYRETHDLFHTVLGMPTNMLGEVTVKWVEAIQTRLPMCIGGALFGPVRLKPKHRQLYIKHYLPWAITTGLTAEFLLNVYFEKRWDQSINEFHDEFKITPLVLPNTKTS